MRFIGKIVSLAAAASCALTLASCGGLREKYDKYDRTGERYDYDLSEYVAVPEYRGIEVPALDYTPSEEDIENARMLKRAYFAPETEVNEPCAKYDLVDADYSATVDGVNYSRFDSSVESARRSFMVGVGNFGVKEIDDGIVGMEPKEEKTISFTFPEPYLQDPEMSGKSGEFTIRIAAVRRQEFPEYTDDFVEEHYGFPSVDEYDDEIVEQLTHDMRLNYSGYEKRLAWNYIMDNAKVYGYPGKELSTARDAIVESVMESAEASGLSFDDFVVEAGYDDRNDFYDRYVEPYARETVKEEMILFFIARAENVILTRAEYESELISYCSLYEITDVKACEEIVTKSFGSLARFKEQLIFKKTQSLIGDATVAIPAADYYANVHAGKYTVSDDAIEKAMGSDSGDAPAIVALSAASVVVIIVIVFLAVKIAKKDKPKKKK